MKYFLILLLIFSTNLSAKCFEPMSLLEVCKTKTQIEWENAMKAYKEKCKAELAKKKPNRIKPKSTKHIKK